MSGSAAARNMRPVGGDPSTVSGAAPPDTVQGKGGQRRVRVGLLAALGRYRAVFGLLSAALMLGFVAKAVISAGAALDPAHMSVAIAATPTSAIALSLLFTGFSFAALVFYDLAALAEIGRRLPLGRVALISFTAYAVGNTAGFGALSGGAIRYRSYTRAGLSAGEVGAVVTFVAVAFGLGLTAVTAAALLAAPTGVGTALGLDSVALRLAALGTLAVLVIGGAAARRFGPLRLGPVTLTAPSGTTMLRQFAVTGVDIAVSALALYVLLPETAIGWPAFVAVYAIATGLGVVSHVPAGLGVFETAILAALGPNVDFDAAVGALVLYRIIYHAVPLALAVAILLVDETVRLVGQISALNLMASRQGLAAALCMAGSLCVGALLIAVPLDAAPPFVLAASLCGFGLVIAARGLVRRLDGALWFSLSTSLGAGALSAFAGEPVSAVASVLLGVLLWRCRAVFTGSAVLFGRFGAAPWLVVGVAFCLSLGCLAGIVLGEGEASGFWWSYWLSGSAPDGAQFLVALASLAAAVSLALLLRPTAAGLAAPTPEALNMALKIVEAEGSADAKLVRMGDKNVLFSQDGDAFIMYAKSGRSWIALFDPVGPKQAWPGLVSLFIDTARAAGCRAVFYQVSTALLPTCADAGLRALKLGEQAVVDLCEFDLKGGKWASLRRSINRAARDGLAFSLVEPGEAVGALMDELKGVSDNWLAHHNVREKTFSLGAFDPAYVAAHPVAVIRLDGRIVAFATLLETPARRDVCIDLMRFMPGIHRGMMDFLFVSIMEDRKAKGFSTLNLGMAPLAGMAERQTAPLWDRLGRTIFEFGESLYNFKGLLAFKSKFDPQWQPRYLVVSGGINPYLALMDVAILIGGGVHGLFRK